MIMIRNPGTLCRALGGSQNPSYNPNVRVTRRPATPADTEFARRIHHAAVRGVVERQFGRWDQTQQDSFFAADWEPAVFEMILVDDAIVGYCAIESRADDIHLRELVIDPTYQGRGIGTALLAELKKRAAQMSKPVRLATLRLNHASDLYARLGFQVVGTTPTHVLMEWRPAATSTDS